MGDEAFEEQVQVVAGGERREDAIFATGVLLRDLLPLLSTEVPRGQIFRASPSRIQPRRALAFLKRVATQQGASAEQLLRDLSP